jgi:hypothetical protein
MIPGSASSLLLASAAGAGGYAIERSLRFNSSDSAYEGKRKSSVPLPSQQEIKKFLCYDSETGIFTRAITSSPNAQRGMKAGYPCKRGYIRITINNRKYLAHRLAWVYMTGEDPGDFEVDHINRNKSDNRFENLRLVSDQANSINCGMRRHNTSGVRGVYWDKQMSKWGAQIRNKGRKIHLGYHVDLDEATAAYDKAALEIHGEYAITNAMLQEVA